MFLETPIPRLTTERLVLAEMRTSNLKDLHEIFSNESSMKYYDTFPHKTLEETKSIIAINRTRFDKNIGIRWGVFINKKLIGTCGFIYFKPKRRGLLSYEINSKYCNQGYATEAVSKVIEYGFNSLSIHRIEALVHPKNIISAKVLKKCGFEKEGILTDYVFYKNDYQTQIMFAIINAKPK